MPRIRWMFSPRPRKRAAELRELLLTAEDLGGGSWQVEGGRIWTRGAAGPNEDWAERARAAGLITVWRAFRRPGTHQADIELEGEQLTTLVGCYPVRNYVLAIHHASPALALDEFTRIVQLQASRMSDYEHSLPPCVSPSEE